MVALPGTGTTKRGSHQVSSRTGAIDAEEAVDTATPTRTISRRVGLPSGRAVTGALLVTLAIVGLFASYRSAQADTGSPYVVVASTVPAGQVISSSDLVIRNLDIGELAGRTMTSTSDVVGAVAVQTMLPGQLVQPAMLVAGDDAEGATFEVSFSIERSRALGGRLVPGEIVDVLATVDDSGDSCTTLVAPKARIVSVGSGGDESLTKRSDFSVTLALTASDHVLGVVFAADEADVTLIRSTRVQGRSLDGSFCGATALDQVETEAGAS